MHWIVLSAVLLGAGCQTSTPALQPVPASKLARLLENVEVETDPGTAHRRNFFRAGGELEREGRFGNSEGRYTVGDGEVCLLITGVPRECWEVLEDSDGGLFLGSGDRSRRAVAKIKTSPLKTGADR